MVIRVWHTGSKLFCVRAMTYSLVSPRPGRTTGSRLRRLLSAAFSQVIFGLWPCSSPTFDQPKPHDTRNTHTAHGTLASTHGATRLAKGEAAKRVDALNELGIGVVGLDSAATALRTPPAA